ncbi:MAG: hypothetical protein Q9207_004194 [Kuettlingeria erythrocarpa]
MALGTSTFERKRWQKPTEDEEFHTALGQIEMLLNTRKNLVYSEGPVADLDAIISDHLQDLLDKEQPELEVDRVRALSKLSWMQRKMINQHFYTFQIEQLINRMVQQMRNARGIPIAPPVVHYCPTPVAQFATLGKVVTTDPPNHYIRLAFCPSYTGTGKFEVHHKSHNYYKQSQGFGFNVSQIAGVSWSEGNYRVTLRCEQGANQSRKIFIDMMHDRDVMKFFDFLVARGFEEEFRCISR